MTAPLTLSQTVAENAARVGHKIPHTLCPTCNGHQYVPLDPHLLATWQALDPVEGRIVSEIAARMGTSKPTVDYRLSLLAQLGLARITRRRPKDPDKKHTKPAAEWIRLDLELEGPGQGQLFGATP